MSSPADVRLGVAELGPLTRADRDALAGIVTGTGHFRDREVAVALQRFDHAFAPGGGDGRDADGTAFVGARDAQARLLGFGCWGRTPNTRGTCNLYGLAVAPDAQRAGVGSALLQACEDDMLHHGGRLAVVTTSGHPEAEGVRRFYEHAGYLCAAVVPDFYQAGDDRLTYCKRLVARAQPDHRWNSAFRL